MKRVPVSEGVTLACEDVGEGPPVVLVHGGCMSHRVWDAQITALADAGYRVIAPDLRGHGDSDKPPGGYTAAGFANDIEALTNQLGVERFALLGWSLGSTVVSEFVCRSPERVEQLVIVSSSIFQRIAAAQQGTETNRLPLERMIENQRHDRPRGMERFVSGMFAGEPPEWTKRWLWEIGMETPMRVAIEMLEIYRDPDGESYRDGLADLAVPSAVFHGVQDSSATVAETETIAEDILAEGRLVTFEASGHVPFLEQEVQFTEELLAFLEA